MPMQNALRPVLASVLCLPLALSLAGCGELDEPVRFQTLAERVAAIPVDDQRTYPRSAAEAGLRAAPAPLQVAVMEPHDMWDARDRMMDAAVAQAVPVVAPVVARAASEQVRRQVNGAMRPAAAPATRFTAPSEASPQPPLRPAEAPARAGPNRMVQLGAFSSHSAAQAAWSRLSQGNAREALQDLSPVFEPVEVDGRQLVRLKVRASSESARQICAAARISDAWCHRS